MPPAQRISDRRTVLLVDDSAQMRWIVQSALEGDGRYELLGQAPHGQAAVAFAAEQCPDVIVLDHQMPHLTGVQAAPLLRASCPDAHIVMWSSDLAVEREAVAAGVNAFVSKSAPLAELIDALSAA